MLFIVTAVFLLVTVISIGVIYFKLHALPEQMAHRGQKVQFQLVSVLALLALFTHNHAFWIAGLLLALVPLPDFKTPILSMADSLQRIAANSGAPAQPPPAADTTAPQASGHTTPPPAVDTPQAHSQQASPSSGAGPRVEVG